MKPCCSAKREQFISLKSADHKKMVPITDKRELFNSKRMIDLDGGEFLMGTNGNEGFPADGEGPVRKVKVQPFAIDRYTVTNNDFQTFNEETGYITDAERYGWSFVFHMFVSEETKKTVDKVVQQTPWWFVVDGASWKHPEGLDSSIKDRMNHPAVHISWNDALAYCEWSGTRLPTEAEWEYAARGGLEQQIFPWGNELEQDGKHHCNVWQGAFPNENTVEDGYVSTAPVDAYAPNGYGLYNVVGNVWEWCADWFSPSHPNSPILTDPKGPASGDVKVMKGGSYLCHESYCNRYRLAARTGNTPDSSSGNMGFRVVKSL